MVPRDRQLGPGAHEAVGEAGAQREDAAAGERVLRDREAEAPAAGRLVEG
jgi:hypothetical protein